MVVLAQCAFGTTWSAAYPYTQQIEGQDVVVKAISYAPHSPSRFGLTKVYFKNKLLYSIDQYFREKIFTSDDGQLLMVVHSSNLIDVMSYSVSGEDRVYFDQAAIEVFKNGHHIKTYTLKDVVDTTMLAHNGEFFNWGYSFDFEAFDYAEIGCESCIEVYGRKILRKGDTTEIFPDELEECVRECDSTKLKRVESNLFENSIFVKNNALFILTNQNTVVNVDFETLEIQITCFDQVVPDKKLFDPPKLKRKYKQVKLPDKFDEPLMEDGRSFEMAIADYLDSSISEKSDEPQYSVSIDYVILNKEGKCVDFNGEVYRHRPTENLSKEPDQEEMTDKFNRWMTEQTFETKLIPKGFEGFFFLYYIKVKH